MKLLPIAALAALLCSLALPTDPLPAPQPAFHCQVPCGIYGDKMRIDMMMEDLATIDKAMASLRAMDAEENPSKNQMVRWVMAKEEHAQHIQTRVASYWLAQRVKLKKEDGGKEKYLAQLTLTHQITVAAMKCKQTTDDGNAATLKRAILEFKSSYFGEEDAEHIREHHGDGHK
jgi:ribosomal protein L11